MSERDRDGLPLRPATAHAATTVRHCGNNQLTVPVTLQGLTNSDDPPALRHATFVVIIIIIIIVAWSRTVAPLRDLWQPQQTIVLTGGFRHLRELDPPRYVEVGLDDDASSDPVSCLLLCRLPVTFVVVQTDYSVDCVSSDITLELDDYLALCNII